MAVTINGSAGVTTNSGAVYDSLQRATAVTCAGQTSIDFTGIPSWVKRITVMFQSVSTSGTSLIQIQLGDSGGIETTGYIATGGFIQGGSTTYSGAANATSGFIVGSGNNAAGNSQSAVFQITNISGNSWCISGSSTPQISPGVIYFSSGSKTLSDTLTQVRITTVNGTDTFDTTPSAGTINIIYE